MILYTPLSESDIFPSSENAYKNRECINYNGKMIIADKTDDGSYQMVQLISTDPQDYLDQRYIPGTFLS
ncbi:YlzJ-like family protein [Oceanobacillus bengalensis]|uniref:Uncharacterized protein n=1 Tax=Oceanobacillus bengalensis TaxID=1435466 RepID=A0A494Z4C6_9BACI|nr:YlzJ-like family protein [Oceanobacillus bengalensis]RKQ17318.1 hypothetical protein D8M05_04625 [Oceanobacillus bengalensis]